MYHTPVPNICTFQSYHSYFLRDNAHVINSLLSQVKCKCFQTSDRVSRQRNRAVCRAQGILLVVRDKYFQTIIHRLLESRNQGHAKSNSFDL